MRLPFPRAGLAGFSLLAATAIVLSVSSGGCGRTACFVYTQDEYDRAGHTCPAQKDALVNFTDPHCAGPIISVNSAGEFSLLSTDPTRQQGLCCYSVTEESVTPTFASGCTGPGGQGGAGGSVTMGMGEVDVGETVGDFMGVGGGPNGPCVTCSQVLLGVGMAQLCPGSVNAKAWDNLLGCLCGVDAGPCGETCSFNVCQNQPISTDCSSCIESASGICAADLMTCESN
jgi:hypothetical protein